MSSARKLRYSLAINEAFHQMMAADASVFLMGQGRKAHGMSAIPHRAC